MIQKLSNKGFTHTVILAGFVMLFAIIGVGFIVATHADTNEQTDPIMDVTSGEVTGLTKSSHEIKVETVNPRNVNYLFALHGCWSYQRSRIPKRSLVIFYCGNAKRAHVNIHIGVGKHFTKGKWYYQ